MMNPKDQSIYSDTVLSIFSRANKSQDGTTTCTLDAVVNRIKSGDKGLIAKTEKCRQFTDKKAYRKYKGTALPAVTFSGQFDTRHADKLKTHSGLITIDLDDCDVADVMSEITQMPECVFAYISPSGAGVKAVFAVTPIPKDEYEHKDAFNAVKIKMEHIAKVDETGSDVSRLCLFAYDPQAYYNPTPEHHFTWEPTEHIENEPEQTETETKSNPTNTNIDLSALDYINSDDYDTWIKIGIAIKNQGLDFSIWNNWSKKSGKYDADETRKKWDTFRKKISWGSVVDIAKKKGYTHTANNHFEVREKKEPTETEYPQLPDDVFYGAFSDLYDTYIGKGNYVLDAPFVLALGLSAVGLISARKRYIKAYEDADVVLFPNMYSLVVGTSTYASKSTTREHLVRLIDNVYYEAAFDNEINLFSSITSKTGLLAELETDDDIGYFDGVKALLHFDELKAMFDNMRRDYATDVQALLNTLWSCPIREQNRAISNKIDAFYPVMNIFGCSTREWLNAALIKDDLDGGFMNRFMSFYSDGLENYISKPTIDKKSYDKFLQKLIRLLDEPVDKKGERRAQGYILDDEAFTTYDAYCEKAYTQGRKRTDNVGTRRSSLHALKIALALHIITDPQEHKIGFKCIDTAITIAEYIEQVGTYLYSEVVSDQSAKIEQRILSLLNRKDNSLPKRKILMSLRDAGYREVGNVIDGLLKENILYFNKENGNIEVQKIVCS